MLIYSPVITERLRYMADFAGKEIAGKPFELISDKTAFLQVATSTVRINYSEARLQADEIWIKPHTLLFEENITSQVIECFEVNGGKAFFNTDGDFPFDILAASFYLLSRYEEYLPHEKDTYGRYAHENSIAYNEGFLSQPLVNQWFISLKKMIEERFPDIPSYQRGFSFLPTYDIDIAWSYKYKGIVRSFGGMLQDLASAKWQHCLRRFQVLLNKKKDPYDTYDWLHQLHRDHQLKPHYFFLLANRTSRYDRNTLPGREAIRNLIKQHDQIYPVGIHPSWRSGDEPGLLKREMQTLATVTGKKIESSRQHYIRLSLPGTFRQLITAGICSDFSMGYGSINGFRASVATPFLWYDLGKESFTDLMLFPFCYMEANSFYEQKYTPGQAIEELRHYYKVTRAVGGTFITIWHNQFFGTDPLFAGWKEIYEKFIREIKVESNAFL